MKIINKAKECGWRKQIITRLGFPTDIYCCAHTSTVIGTCFCNKEDEFPITCPLKEGLIKDSIHWP